MTRHTISVQSYLDALSVFHWATIDDFDLWFPGQIRRSRKVLKRLADRGKVRAIKNGDGKKMIYALPRKSKGVTDVYSHIPKIRHGLACTKCLVRVWRSKMTGEIFAERFFKKVKPEWAIRYTNHVMLCFEFATKDNFTRSGLMRGKFQAYEKVIPDLEEEFKARIIVLFVIDIPRSALERYVGSVGSLRSPLHEGTDFPNPFFFVDYQSLLATEIGKTLQSPIFFWAGDGKERSLSA
jgi:hypothetical protein